MDYKSTIRKIIRDYLIENSNIGIDNINDIDYSEENIDDLISLSQDKRKEYEDRLSSMKKQFGIPSHPDSSINRMIKRTDKIKMDNISDDIEDAEKQEDKLKKNKETLEKMNQQNKEYKDKINQLSQTSSQVQSDSSITNM